VVSPSTDVLVARGCEIVETGQAGFAQAIQIAEKADVVIMVMGLSQQVEGEEGQTEGNPEGKVSLGDRDSLDLPGEQEALLKAVTQTGKPVVLVLLNGSAVAINWADEHVPAILEAWYPGQSGGRAVAEALFGDYNPGGKLPVTFYKSADQLPSFDDYTMAGRTYRYFAGDVLYPFGYGLSFTSFNYHNLALSHEQIFNPEVIRVSVEIENTGTLTGDEVVQVYLRDKSSAFPVPRHSLVGFKRIRLSPNARERVMFEINPRQMAVVNEAGDWMLEPGGFSVFVGGGQPETDGCLSARFEFLGEPQILAERFLSS
jgi:beta-glucosidase